MKFARQRIILALVCIAIGFCLGNLVDSPTAEAQKAAPVTAPRFQISSYSSTTGNSILHGAYVVDTMSSKVWHVRGGDKSGAVMQSLD